MHPNISVITEDIYLKLRVVVHYQEGTHTSRGGNPSFILTKLCPFFDLEFSKCSFRRALAPACGALVLTKLCHFFDLEFSKCSFRRALAPACGALVLTKLCSFFDLEFSKCSYSQALTPAFGALVRRSRIISLLAIADKIYGIHCAPWPVEMLIKYAFP